MDSKQFEILLGISRSMEKSLQNIENSFSTTSKTAAKSTGVLATLSNSLGAIVAAVSTKAFNSKKANDILSFSKGLAEIASSVDPDSAKAFGEFATGISTAFETIVGMVNPVKLLKLKIGVSVLFGGKKPIIKTITEGMSKAFADIDSKKVERGAKAIQAIGDGLLSLSKALKSLIVIGIAAPLVLVGAMVARGVVAMFISIGKKAKEIDEGGAALKTLGKGLMVFAAGIAVMTLALMIVGPTKIVGIIAVVALFAVTFSLIGKLSSSIDKGTKSIARMGLALFGFAAALATLMLAILISTPKMILMGLATLMAFAMVFWAIGRAASKIAEGALVMILGMAVGLFIFSGALMVLGLALKLYDWETLLMGAVLITAMGVAFNLIGKYEKQITKGALAMAEMGAGLILFGAGIMVFGVAVKLWMVIFKGDLMTAGIVAGALILGLGLAFAAVGFLSGNITAGALAIGEIGGALIMFSVGILVFGVAIKLLQVLFKDIAQAGLIAGAIILGLALAFAGIGLMMVPIALGAIAIGLMGAALIAFSVGILIFGVAIKLLQTMFDDLSQAGIIAGSIIIGLGLAFSVIGLLIVPVVLGTVATILMGGALVVFSVGLMVFGAAMKFMLNIFDGDLDTMADSIGSVLWSTGLAFSGVGLLIVPIVLGSVATTLMAVPLMLLGAAFFVFGASMKYLNENGLLIDGKDGYEIKGMSVLVSMAGVFSEVGWASLSPMPWLGIAFSIGMGASLFVVGMGLQKAAEALAAIPDMSSFITSLFADGGLIPSMAEAFAQIGNKYSGGLLSSWLGADPVSLGVKTVKGFGDVLSDVAGGIVAFADFTQFPVKVPDPKDPSKLIYSTVDIFTDILPALNANLPILLSTLATTFADIGNKFGGESGWFGEDSPVQKGVDAVSGLGTVLSELAGGIVAFSRFDEFPVQVPDPKDPSKLIYKSVNLWEAIPKIKEALVGDLTIQGKVTAKTGILMSLAEVFASIAQKYPDGFMSDSDVQSGVEAVKGIGGVLADLAKGITGFANLERGLPEYDKDGKITSYTKIDLKKIEANIVRVLTSLPNAFATIDVDAMEKAQEKAKAAQPLVKTLSEMSKSMEDLMVEKTETEKTNILDTLGPSLSKFAKDIKGVKLDNAQLKSLDSLATILTKLAKIGDSLGKFAESLSATGKAFTTFGAGFDTFAKSLDKFQKFEKSFSNLIKGQYTYKFDRFEASMGKFKTHVNAFDVQKLTMTESMMKSMAIISRAPEALGETISETLEESFQQLVDTLKVIIKDATPKSVSPVTGGETPEEKGIGGITPTGATAEDATQKLMIKLKEAFDNLGTKIDGIGGQFPIKNGKLWVNTETDGY